MLAIVGLVVWKGAFCGGGGRNEGGRAKGCEGRIVRVQLGERGEISTVRRRYCGFISWWSWEEGGYTDLHRLISTLIIGTISVLDCHIPHCSGRQNIIHTMVSEVAKAEDGSVIVYTVR